MGDASTIADSAVELGKMAAATGSPVALLGWWLRSKFANIEKAGEKRMQLHEKQDERRHRENLVRFAKINMKLDIDDATEMNGSHRDGEEGG